MSVNKAESVTPPVQGQNLWKLAGSSFGAVSYIAIPADWKGAYLTLEAVGDDWSYAFSESPTGNASATATAASTVASNAISAIGANVLKTIKDGQVKNIDMAQLNFHKVKTLILLSANGAGYLEIERSSGPVSP